MLAERVSLDYETTSYNWDSGQFSLAQNGSKAWEGDMQNVKMNESIPNDPYAPILTLVGRITFES